jgi:hypothetical protein
MYYVWELYREGRMADAAFYVDTWQNVEVQFAAAILSRGRHGGKLAFHERCEKAGLRTVSVLATCSADGKRSEILQPDSEAWQGDLYEKPSGGMQGKGIRRWTRQEGGGWASGDHRVRTRDELLAFVSSQARKDIHMVQPRHLNHEDVAWVPDGPISTVRIVTLRPRGGGDIAIVPPWMRIPRAGAAVDNLHQGGLLAPVDLATGRVGRVFRWDELGVGPGQSHHPDSERPVEGAAVPFWEEALELCRRAQDIFYEWPSVGWDVGIDAAGPFLLEMNGLWGSDCFQAPDSPPFGLTRYGAIMLEHLRAEARLLGML